MSDARWQRLQELFDELVGMPAAARIAWLARTDADPDADLKREALALVEAEPRAGMTGKLREIAEQLAPCDPVNLRLGPYRLIAEIGSGGMGTVFVAERVDENFDQRVAIKLLRGIPTRESTERMRRERQILAGLQHPRELIHRTSRKHCQRNLRANPTDPLHVTKQPAFTLTQEAVQRNAVFFLRVVGEQRNFTTDFRKIVERAHGRFKLIADAIHIDDQPWRRLVRQDAS